MEIIDTHAHLDMAAFDKDRAGVISRAVEAGVKTIVSVGIDLASSRMAIALAEANPEVRATVGFHPHEASRLQKADLDTMLELTRHPKVVAIGEIGLDFYRNLSPREEQLEALRWQLELAGKAGLPVIIHTRQAETDILNELGDWATRYQPPTGRARGVIHCFSESLATAQRCLEMGFYIAFGGYVGYPSSRRLYDVIKAIPDDRIVVETDCPFLPPQPYRGQRNEPSYLPITLDVLAGIRGVSAEKIAEETTRNARRLFRL